MLSARITWWISTLLLALVAACARGPLKPTTATGCASGDSLCWDFEEGALPAGWTAHRDEFDGQLLVDDTRARSGRYALHARELVGGREGTQGGPKKPRVRHARLVRGRHLPAEVHGHLASPRAARIPLEWLFDGANGSQPEAAEPRVWLNGVELEWPERFVFSDPPTTVPPVREKATGFQVIETGVFLYQGLSVPTDWWIDDLAIGKQRIGCGQGRLPR